MSKFLILIFKSNNIETFYSSVDPNKLPWIDVFDLMDVFFSKMLCSQLFLKLNLVTLLDTKIQKLSIYVLITNYTNSRNKELWK